MTILIFILILGLIIFIHELGHFIFAKRAKIYCYEFSLGMGPKIFSFNRKNDETLYCIRLFPIGGYVKMAGEDDDKDVEFKDKIQSKTFFQKFLTIIAGALFNFLLGFFILFLISLIYGSYTTKPIVGNIDKNYNVYKEGIRENDIIYKVDGKKIYFQEDVLLMLEMKEENTLLKLEVKRKNEILSFEIMPSEETIEEEKVFVYGLSFNETKNYGLITSIKFGFSKFVAIYTNMFRVLFELFAGNLSFSSLSGPVGIYSIVGESAKLGFENLLFLVAALSINVGFINLIPFPAFDGGRLIFLVIEKIIKKPIDPKIENTIHTIGFAILMCLIVYVTYKDIINIFK